MERRRCQMILYKFARQKMLTYLGVRIETTNKDGSICNVFDSSSSIHTVMCATVMPGKIFSKSNLYACALPGVVTWNVVGENEFLPVALLNNLIWIWIIRRKDREFLNNLIFKISWDMIINCNRIGKILYSIFFDYTIIYNDQKQWCVQKPHKGLGPGAKPYMEQMPLSDQNSHERMNILDNYWLDTLHYLEDGQWSRKFFILPVM